MKRFSSILIIAAVASIFNACDQREIEAPVQFDGSFEFTSPKPVINDDFDTKTGWTGSSVQWLKGDNIRMAFKVDNVWKINQNYPSILNKGNLNNYIYINKLENNKEKSEGNTDENTESSSKYSTNNKNIKINKKGYRNYFPKDFDLSIANIAPENFWKIKNEDNVNNIRIIENEKINHLNVGLKKNEYIKNKNIHSNIVSVSIFSRYT